MGIDIFLTWPGMTEYDKERQTAKIFDPLVGEVGYLREAYRGGPYATHIVFREAFRNKSCRARISAKTMRKRMHNVTEPARNCNTAHHVAQAIANLFANKTLSFGTEPAAIIAQINALNAASTSSRAQVTQPMTGCEAIRTRCQSIYPEQGPDYPEKVIASFYAFIALAEQKEKKTGKRCTVYASY